VNPLRALALALAVLCLGACAARKPRGEPAPTPPAPAARVDPVPHETSLPQSQRYKQTRDSEPEVPTVDVSTLVEPVPRVEPRARYGNKSPYSVLGRTYSVLPDASGYLERGIASWYGKKFHGYMTSSLEPYDMYQFSAAHKSLPLPSWARVTNLDNGKSVIVRVNDRGPFHENRLIDLSYAAAVRIGIWPRGTGLVEVRVIDAAHPAEEPAGPDAVTSKSAGARIYLQLGAFGDRDNAERVLAQIDRARLGTASIQTTAVDGRPIHRVRLGPLASVEVADSLTTRVEQLGLGTPRVAIEE